MPMLDPEERSGILQVKIQEYVARGYRLITKDQTTAQLVLKKKFSFWMFILLVGVFYIPYYFSKKDKMVFLVVDKYGNVSETQGKG